MDIQSNSDTSEKFRISDCLNELKVDCKIFGLPDRIFTNAYNIWEGKEGTITFASSKRLENIIDTINNSKASVIITEIDLDIKKINIADKTIILVEKPRDLFIKIINQYLTREQPYGILHPSSIIDEEANIHETVSIGPYCVIGKCTIGKGTFIHANVIINDSVEIGQNVVINPSTVIGFDGFGYSRGRDGILQKFPHFGGVIIEDEVEIGSNVSIDRGSLSNTIIRKGSKIDNFSHIAHNVEIGKNCQVIAHSMVGGSTKIGDESHIAPASILRDCINIGNNVTIGLGAVVTKDIPDDQIVVGNPAEPIDLFLKKKRIIKGMIQDP